ncbi:MAG: single-stranded DNA-binding protein [Bacteroidetes bacterium]|nr:single-stranded DNA-binding protein [Bacteroidota bacterium]
MPFSSSGINRVFLLGSVAEEPHWQEIEGKEMLCFRLSTTEKLKRGDSFQEHTEYHNIKIPPEMVNDAVCPKRNQHLFIQGKVQTRVVFHDGVKLYRCEILAASIRTVDNDMEYLIASIEGL